MGQVYSRFPEVGIGFKKNQCVAAADTLATLNVRRADHLEKAHKFAQRFTSTAYGESKDP